MPSSESNISSLETLFRQTALLLVDRSAVFVSDGSRKHAIGQVWNTITHPDFLDRYGVQEGELPSQLMLPFNEMQQGGLLVIDDPDEGRLLFMTFPSEEAARHYFFGRETSLRPPTDRFTKFYYPGDEFAFIAFPVAGYDSLCEALGELESRQLVRSLLQLVDPERVEQSGFE